MNRRFSLKRSDNYPLSGTYSSVASGDGSFVVTTNHPITSAHISHSISYGSSLAVALTLEEETQEIDSTPLDYTFSPTSTVVVQQVELEFSRGDTLRQFSVSCYTGGNTVSLDSGSNSTVRRVLIEKPIVLNNGEWLRLFADVDDSTKSSSSSSSSSSNNSASSPSSDSSEALTSSSSSLLTSSSSINRTSSSSSSSSESSSEALTSSSSSLLTSSSSINLTSSSSSSSSESSSSSSESSSFSSSSFSVSSSPSFSSQSSSSSVSRSSSSSINSSSSSSSSDSSSSTSPSSDSSISSTSSSESSQSSSGTFRVKYRIYYIPVEKVQSITESYGTKVTVNPDGYTDLGFTVDYENAPVNSVLTINYISL